MSQLPLRKSAKGGAIETRPLYIEEWLDTLPYIDFRKTGALLHEALTATNKTAIKASRRLQLVELYNRPYQYYIESRIKTGTQHSLQTLGTVQAEIGLMKRIAVDLSYACRLAVETVQKQKSLWGQGTPPVAALLMSMHYLSHALIFSFLEYAPPPKKVWSQLNYIYGFAESLKNHKNIYAIPGANNKPIQTSVEHTYKRIIMASLADPHRLPFGAIWEIYEQLDNWAESVRIHPMQSVADPTGHFVIDLGADSKAIPYAKFNKENKGKKIRLLDSTPLEHLIRRQLDLIQAGEQVDNSMILSPFYAESLLGHILKAWGSPPKRYFPRKPRPGNMNIVVGINGLYYFLNDGKAFQQTLTCEADNDNEISISALSSESSNIPLNYVYENWRIVDEGSMGYAVIRDKKLKKPVRVGDLVGINLDGTTENWGVAVIRWLMVSRETHKIGLQQITDTAEPVSLRTGNGSHPERGFRPAFLIRQKNDPARTSIIADKGLVIPDREMEINAGGKNRVIVARSMSETNISHEIFHYEER